MCDLTPQVTSVTSQTTYFKTCQTLLLTFSNVYKVFKLHSKLCVDPIT